MVITHTSQKPSGTTGKAAQYGHTKEHNVHRALKMSCNCQASNNILHNLLFQKLTVRLLNTDQNVC